MRRPVATTSNDPEKELTFFTLQRWSVTILVSAIFLIWQLVVDWYSMKVAPSTLLGCSFLVGVIFFVESYFKNGARSFARPSSLFILAFIVWYVFGSYVPILIDQEMAVQLHTVYFVDKNIRDQFIKLVFNLTIFFVLAVAFIQTFLTVPKVTLGVSSNYYRVVAFFGVGLSIIGLFFLYLATFLREILGPTFLMPGVVFSLAELRYPGLILLVYSAIISKRYYLALSSCLVAAICILSAWLDLMKTPIIETIFVLALVACRLELIRLKQMMIALVIAIGLWTVLSPLSTVARDCFWSQKVCETVDVPERFFQLAKDEAISGGVFRRLYLTNVTVLGADSFYHGYGLDTFEKLKFIFIPRIIYPEKPNMSSGGEFASDVRRSSHGGSIGPGFLGEFLMNFGYSALPLVCSGLLLILFVGDHVYRASFSFNTLYLMPAYFQITRIATRLDDFVSTNLFGAIPLILAMTVIAYVVFKLSVLICARWPLGAFEGAR